MPVVARPVVVKVKAPTVVAPVKKAHVPHKPVDLAKVARPTPLTKEERSKPPHRKAPAETPQ